MLLNRSHQLFYTTEHFLHTHFPTPTPSSRLLSSSTDTQAPILSYPPKIRSVLLLFHTSCIHQSPETLRPTTLILRTLQPVLSLPLFRPRTIAKISRRSQRIQSLPLSPQNPQNLLLIVESQSDQQAVTWLNTHGQIRQWYR